MKTVFEAVIGRGGYDLPTMLEKIDSYHIEGKLTGADRDALQALARSHAQAAMDIPAKLLELDARLTALEGSKALSEFRPGAWYYAGDTVLWQGKAYRCTAPAGQVCTWSPEAYPAYWEEA